MFKENKITAIVKDSSAARNGVLIDHHMVEVNGQNVIGLKVSTRRPEINDLTLPSGWAGCYLPSAEAVSVRPNAQPRCNQKVTVIGCEAEQITSHLGLVTCSMVVPIRRSALG